MSTRLKDNVLVRLLGPLLYAHRFKLLVVRHDADFLGAGRAGALSDQGRH